LSLDVFVGIADSYVDNISLLADFRLPLLSRPIGHRENVGGCLDRMTQVISVLERDLPIDPVTGPWEIDVNPFSDRQGGIRLDRDVGMEFFDDEELGKGRRYEDALDDEDNNHFPERFHLALPQFLCIEIEAF
jgi:hypothetical protein